MRVVVCLIIALIIGLIVGYGIDKNLGVGTSIFVLSISIVFAYLPTDSDVAENTYTMISTPTPSINTYVSSTSVVNTVITNEYNEELPSSTPTPTLSPQMYYYLHKDDKNYSEDDYRKYQKDEEQKRQLEEMIQWQKDFDKHNQERKEEFEKYKKQIITNNSTQFVGTTSSPKPTSTPQPHISQNTAMEEMIDICERNGLTYEDVIVEWIGYQDNDDLYDDIDDVDIECIIEYLNDNEYY